MPVWFIPLFLVFILLMFEGIVAVIALVGWSPLARSFRARSTPSGTQFGTVSASINGCNYNNCLRAIVATEGLWLQPWLLLRSFHPALSIPWSAFTHFEEHKVLWLTRASMVVTTPQGRRVRILLAPEALTRAAHQRIQKVSSQDVNPAERSPWNNEAN